jgi:dolichol kinase
MLVVAAAPALSLPVGALGVFIAAVVEAAPLPVNDNIRVPLAAALAVTLVQVGILGEAVQWGWVGSLW